MSLRSWVIGTSDASTSIYLHHFIFRAAHDTDILVPDHAEHFDSFARYQSFLALVAFTLDYIHL